MYDEIKKYLDACNEAEAQGKELPRIPNYLGECFIKIADKFGTKPSFGSYSYLEEMKGDGIINCIKYIRNFDPNRTNNPFAYFTQYIKNAFFQRIDLEKTYQYNKYKVYQELQIAEQINGDEGACGPDLNDISNHYVQTFDDKMATKRRIAREKIAATKVGTVTSLYED